MAIQGTAPTTARPVKWVMPMMCALLAGAVILMMAMHQPTEASQKQTDPRLLWGMVGALVAIAFARPAVRYARAHWLMAGLFATSAFGLGGLYLGLQHRIVREGEKMKAVARAQAALTSDTRADWHHWQTEGLTADANPGSLQLMTDGPAKWVLDTRAPSADYVGKFELDASHVWLGIADQPYLVRYNGASYSKEGTLGTPSGKALWGSAADNVWTFSGVAMSGAFHRDGKEWKSAVCLPTDVHSADGTAANDVWAVGDAGSVYHYDGKQWRPNKPAGMMGAPLELVRAFSSDDVVVAGATGILFHWDSVRWNLITVPLGAGTVTEITGTSSREMTIRCLNGSYRTSDRGKTWQKTKQAPPDQYLKLWHGKVYRRAARQTYVPNGSATRVFTTDQPVKWSDAVLRPKGATVLYSVDGQTWHRSARDLAATSRLKVKVKLETKHRHATPVLDSFTIGHTP